MDISNLTAAKAFKLIDKLIRQERFDYAAKIKDEYVYITGVDAYRHVISIVKNLYKIFGKENVVMLDYDDNIIKYPAYDGYVYIKIFGEKIELMLTYGNFGPEDISVGGLVLSFYYEEKSF